MGKLGSSEQSFNGADVFLIHGVLILTLVCAFLVGFYAAAKKWPSKDPNQSMPVDLFIGLPLSILSTWIVIPRFGLDGLTIISAFRSADPNIITSCFLSLAFLMLFGMSFHFALPSMKDTLATVSSHLLARLQRVFSAILDGGRPTDPDNRNGDNVNDHKDDSPARRRKK